MKKPVYHLLILTIFVLMQTIAVRPLYCGAGSTDNDPLEIRSDTMIADNRNNSIVFEGSVIAQRGTITLKAGKMTAYYDENRTIRQVVAENEVVLLQKDRTITSDHAVYDAKKETISFTGDPVFSEGKNTVSGTSILYFISEERSVVENSRVILHD